MLRRTFLHLPGIGEATERRLWRQGVATWDHMLEGLRDGSLSSARLHGLEPAVIECISNLEGGRWGYFDRLLPSVHKWRAFRDLSDGALYVDIETTGGAGGEAITVIGTYDGTTARCFVAGRDLEEARALIESRPLVVTYNGAQFDLPLIRDRFRYNFFNFIHVDLRFPLARLGYRGGLKAIEQRLGIERSAATRGMNGFDAVLLWRRYEQGSEEALRLLLDYNREDTCHLKSLMELVCREMTRLLDEGMRC
jgi:hypothetical protein